MSKKEIEKNLDYGDCNNLFCFINDIFIQIGESVEKTIDKILNK
jgi:hypothetical protein